MTADRPKFPVFSFFPARCGYPAAKPAYAFRVWAGDALYAAQAADPGDYDGKHGSAGARGIVRTLGRYGCKPGRLGPSNPGYKRPYPDPGGHGAVVPGLDPTSDAR